MNIVRYEPDERCPDLVIWQIAEHGACRPGVRKGFTLDQVRALVGVAT